MYVAVTANYVWYAVSV